MQPAAATSIRLPDRYPSAIVLDLDGTALRPDGTFAPATRTAVADAVDRGVPVAIATGRSETQALALARDLGLVDGTRKHGMPAYVISALGGVTTEAHDGTIVDERQIDPIAAHDVIAYAQAKNDDLTVVTAHRQIARDGTASASGPFTDGHAPDLSSFANDATLIRASGAGVAHDLAQRFAASDVVVRVGHSLGTEQVEIAAPHVDKGTAVLGVLARLGADPARAIAIGDTDVDAPMLRVVGQGVAMGNAARELKALAPYVTRSNAEDGVAAAIESALHGTIT